MQPEPALRGLVMSYASRRSLRSFLTDNQIYSDQDIGDPAYLVHQVVEGVMTVANIKVNPLL